MINSRKIEDLTQNAQIKCKEFIELCKKNEIEIKIIQTLRDAEYQNTLYQIGRSKPGKIITKCDGFKIKSKHQSGNAWDAVPMIDGKIDWNAQKEFKKMAELSKSIGIRAGYYFKMVDSPHFEI